jgi:hypothetical protein
VEHEVEPQFHNGFEMREQHRPQINVLRLAENGLGYGEGNIGVQTRIESDEDLLRPEDLNTVREAIYSGDTLVPVDKDDSGKTLDDDGCGDGRGVGLIEKAGQVLKRSLNRAKVFGGSVTMTVAARIGTGEARENNQEELFNTASDQLDGSEIDYGAHNSDHCGEGESGCGVIDKFADHLSNAEKYRKQISRSAFEVLRATGFNKDKDEREVGAMIDDSLDNFREYNHQFEPAKGSSIFKSIKDRFKVVKELFGDHKEIGIVINMVDGHTVDQELIRKRTEDRAQVFVVDAWRMLDVIARNKSIPEDKKEQAFISELIYSLAVSATLTKGDLPVDLITSTD